VRYLVPMLMAAFALQPIAAGAQAVPITNIEIRMVKTSTRPPLRVTADTRNPNDFAVRDIEVDCTIKDKTGKDVATYSSTIYGVFQPNQHTTTRNLNIGAWPEQGYASLCVSKRGIRVQPAGSPPVAVPPVAPPPAAEPPPPAEVPPTIAPPPLPTPPPQ
jgi:hypothetical protein